MEEISQDEEDNTNVVTVSSDQDSFQHATFVQHDRQQIRTRIAEFLRQKGLAVHEDVSCTSSQGSTLSIDIIAYDEETRNGVILDPTLRMEVGDEGPELVDKENGYTIYEPFFEDIRLKYNLEEVEVIGIIFGAAGEDLDDWSMSTDSAAADKFTHRPSKEDKFSETGSLETEISNSWSTLATPISSNKVLPIEQDLRVNLIKRDYTEELRRIVFAGLKEAAEDLRTRDEEHMADDEPDVGWTALEPYDPPQPSTWFEFSSWERLTLEGNVFTPRYISSAEEEWTESNEEEVDVDTSSLDSEEDYLGAVSGARAESGDEVALETNHNESRTIGPINWKSDKQLIDYQEELRPNFKAMFNQTVVENLANETIRSILGNRVYDTKEAVLMSSFIADCITERVQDLGYERCKIITHVIIGEDRQHGLQTNTSCHWDRVNDHFVTVSYFTGTFFCNACVYGIYYP